MPRTALLACVAVGLLGAGCAGSSGPAVVQAGSADSHSKAVYHALVGELAGKRQQFGQAAAAYLRAAEESRDPQAAEQAVRRKWWGLSLGSTVWCWKRSRSCIVVLFLLPPSSFCLLPMAAAARK